MIERNFRIDNEHGLHARPASLLSETAQLFDSDIKVLFNGKEADAKSILAILLLEVFPGSAVTVIANGADEVEAMNAVDKLITENFDESGEMDAFDN